MSQFSAFISPVTAVLIKVHLYLEGRNSLAGSPGTVKKRVLLTLPGVGGELAALPVLLHVDGLQGVAGGLVVSEHGVGGHQAQHTGQDNTETHSGGSVSHAWSVTVLLTELILTQFLPGEPFRSIEINATSICKATHR